ncbi:hypothetical protein E05_06040 [Plautia stali symbiont]|nr:hypothetical protein E05_06040 [Plautia stali symbiont]
MIKWPWRAQKDAAVTALPWQQALGQTIFSLLSSDEQQALAQRFLLQGLELSELRLARLSLLFCLPVFKAGSGMARRLPRSADLPGAVQR